jgi:putative two-component system response regulator
MHIATHTTTNRPRVLVATADEGCRQSLVETLAALGHETVTAQDGAEAQARLGGDPTLRIAICDWQLGHLDGASLCRWIHTERQGSYTYTIMLVHRDDASAIAVGMGAGADEFLTKPIDRDELAARLRSGERICATETRDAILFQLAKLAESRDPESGQHLERIRAYCHLLADDLRKSGVYAEEADAEFVRLMWLTSPLHDIGKTGIPDSILLKPGRLSDDEFAVMRTHTSIGAETLAEALRHCPDSRYCRIALDIVQSHHERWDGQGYPQRLALERIPLAARIMAIADVYDALTSKRVYKNALSHAVAVNIIVEGSGSHFDPMLVQAFCRQQEAFRAVCAHRDASAHLDSPPETMTLRRAA